MNREQIVEDIRTALSTVLNREIEQLPENVRLVEDLSLDSTSVIELLMTLEDAIGLELDVEDLQPEVFQTVASLADYLAAGASDLVS
ncbi:acyl carrier protein [Streptomyces sp. NPDC088190]|uniref:acyl carrier protein n=1 Tax=unclassified Streptomyces TaxID=2593676 RepID=UPI002E7624F4|nr:phosphopantetheine-binding protein [Streptomyces sp. JV190]MEE1838763.1 phosphopantetheine-binding protein [Streptomyces sp. JV190]